MSNDLTPIGVDNDDDYRLSFVDELYIVGPGDEDDEDDYYDDDDEDWEDDDDY